MAFAPERTAEGVALRELRKNPQIIGAFDNVSYDLASRLFDEGDYGRAAQIAQESLAAHPDHACAGWLSKLAEAAGTYPAGS